MQQKNNRNAASRIAFRRNRDAEMIGKRFGRWVVISRSLVQPNIKNRASYWNCQCDCGVTRSVVGHGLRSGQSKSCGCLKVEKATLAKTKHGRNGSREHSIWRSMLTRCYNPEHISFPRYGAVGKVVCERWHEFLNFYADMGPCPSPKHTLERINNDLGYSPENCKWATREEQMRNTPRTMSITFNGETHCAKDWSLLKGWPHYTVTQRICNGWTEEEALTVPFGHWRPSKMPNHRWHKNKS